MKRKERMREIDNNRFVYVNVTVKRVVICPVRTNFHCRGFPSITQLVHSIDTRRRSPHERCVCVCVEVSRE